MLTKSKNVDQEGPKANSTATYEPWFNIGGHGAFVRVKASKSTSLEQSADARSPSEENNDHKHSPTTKSLLPDISCRANDSDPRQMGHPIPDDTITEPSVQLELAGHTIACTTNHYDPYNGGMVAAYGQPMVPCLYDMQHPRMPLPLEMAEEPVYVNAKQYHGILRRRQSRAKAEVENKLVKSRKPYLHESRHQHAMRRARGSGGRFAKKSGADTYMGTEKNEPDSPVRTVDLSGPEPVYAARSGKTGESPGSSRQWGNIQSGHALAMQ